MQATNTITPMTRRYPKLATKALRRDAKIAARIIHLWDVEKNADAALRHYLKEQDQLSDERYWELLRTLWIIAGKREHWPIFRALFTATRPQRHYFSTPEEQARLRAMPATFTVYRATDDHDDGGLSWTISKQYATDYARMYHRETILARTIEKAQAFAFIERNGEEEIIIL